MLKNNLNQTYKLIENNFNNYIYPTVLNKRQFKNFIWLLNNEWIDHLYELNKPQFCDNCLRCFDLGVQKFIEIDLFDQGAIKLFTTSPKVFIEFAECTSQYTSLIRFFNSVSGDDSDSLWLDKPIKRSISESIENKQNKINTNYKDFVKCVKKELDLLKLKVNIIN